MTAMKVIVVGAGIGGLTAAAALARAGIHVDVVERAPLLREVGSGLGIMTNAVRALRSIGIRGELERHGQVVEDFQFRTARGALITSMPLKEVSDELGAPSVSIHRAALQRVLVSAAEAAGAQLHLGASCRYVEPGAGTVRVHLEDGRTLAADVLIGADGIHSVVRKQLFGNEPLSYAGYVCWLATTPFQHPRFTRGYVGHYWGRGKRFGLVDIGAGQVYWWATQNTRDPASQTGVPLRQRALACVAGWADEVVRAVEATPDSAVLEVPAQDRPFRSVWGSGRITLLGDAAHPMLTSLGQGACMAIEDGVVLARCLQVRRDPIESLRVYEARRRRRTRGMVQRSRLLSMVEQWQRPLPVALRESYFRYMPRRLAHEQTRSLLQFA